MKIHVKYLRYDSHKIALQILTLPIDEVIIGSFFVQFSADVQPVRHLLGLFTLAEVSPVKVKSKA